LVERAQGCVFLLTDYGLSDELAGVLRATVLRHAPGAPLVDLTHGVAPFDVRAGALALARSVPHLGAGVVIGVVDPGVGGERRGLALEVSSETGPRYLVGPDNGLLIWASERLGAVDLAVHLTARPQLFGRSGSTFDGRDLFAPAAAALWNGVPIAELGATIDPAGLTRLRRPTLLVSPGSVETEVLWVDTFGNVQLSATASDAEQAALGDQGLAIEVVGGNGTFRARPASSFAAVGADEIGLIVDANGHLALVGDRTSAARTLGLEEADPVTLLAIPRGGT
jgi:S-adenosyl-L-methionine hydrolase (adenosine-forming)